MTVNCLSPGWGIEITNGGLVNNTRAPPAFRVAPTGGTDSTYQPSTLSNVKFDGFNHTFGSNLLTITPEPPAPILAGDGISVSGMTITNTRPMTNVNVFQDYPSNLSEITIPAEQLTMIAFRDGFTHDWFPGSGVLQLYSGLASMPNVIAGSDTYSGGTYASVRYHGCTASVTTEGENDVINIYPSHTDQPPNIHVQSVFHQAADIHNIVFNTFTHTMLNNTLTLTPPSVGYTQIPDGASTAGSLTIPGDLTCNANVSVSGSLTCDSLTVTQGLPGGGVNQTWGQVTDTLQYIDRIEPTNAPWQPLTNYFNI